MSFPVCESERAFFIVLYVTRLTPIIPEKKKMGQSFNEPSPPPNKTKRNKQKQTGKTILLIFSVVVVAVIVVVVVVVVVVVFQSCSFFLASVRLFVVLKSLVRAKVYCSWPRARFRETVLEKQKQRTAKQKLLIA